MCAVLLPPGGYQMSTVLLPTGGYQMCTVLLPPGGYQMCAVILPPGGNPNAVNKYIITSSKIAVSTRALIFLFTVEVKGNKNIF